MQLWNDPGGSKRNLVAAASVEHWPPWSFCEYQVKRGKEKSLENVSQENINGWDGVDFTRIKSRQYRKLLIRALRVIRIVRTNDILS